MLACDGEYCPYAPDAAHWGVASPVVDPSLLYAALNDESGFEPSVYLLLENEALADDLFFFRDTGHLDQLVDVVLSQAIHLLLNGVVPIAPLR